MKLSWLLWIASILPQQHADQMCLAATIYLEARSEPALGQMAVAEVALRRRESKHWGTSLCDVLTAPDQFALSTTSKNYLFRDVEAWNKAYAIAGKSISAWSMPDAKRKLVVPQADAFIVADSSQPAWIKGPPLATIGAHSFYRMVN